MHCWSGSSSRPLERGRTDVTDFRLIAAVLEVLCRYVWDVPGSGAGTGPTGVSLLGDYATIQCEGCMHISSRRSSALEHGELNPRCLPTFPPRVYARRLGQIEIVRSNRMPRLLCSGNASTSVRAKRWCGRRELGGVKPLGSSGGEMTLGGARQGGVWVVHHPKEDDSGRGCPQRKAGHEG